MSDKPSNKTAIAAAIQNAPAVADVLKKLAGKVARGVRLPASFTARGLDYAAQRELEHLLGTIGQRQPDGFFYMSGWTRSRFRYQNHQEKNRSWK